MRNRLLSKAALSVFFIISMVFVIFGVGILPSMAEDDPRVLVIHSYHRGYEWTDTLHREIVRTISEIIPETDFYVEYMDTKRYFSHGFLFDLAMIYQQKYSLMDMDLVICTDDSAFHLMQYYGANIFPGVPVVFCGLGDPVLARRNAIEGKTGIIQRPSIMKTALLALKIQPQTRNMAILYDSTKTAEENRKVFLDRVTELPGDMEIIHIPQMEEAQLVERLSTLPDNTVILNMGYWRSDDGHFYSSRELMELIRESCDLPIYSTHGFMVEKFGALGGMVDPGVEYGALAGQKSLSILGGTPVEDIPVIWEGPSRYVFNHNEMVRFGIRKADLPRGSMIVNQPRGFFYQHRKIMVAHIMAVLLLLLIAVYLFFNVQRRKKAERNLQREKEFMEQLFENSPEGIVLLDSSDRILRANREMGRLFRSTMEDMVGSGINRIVAGTREMAEEAGRLSMLAVNGHEFTVETVRRRKDGTDVPVAVSGMPFQVEDETMVYGIYRDISERKRSEEKLRKRLNFEEFISRTSSRMVFGSEMDSLIDESLVDLCGIIDASRGCIVFFEGDHSHLNVVHNWVFHDEKRLHGDVEILAPQDLKWMIDHLREFGQLIAEDMDSPFIPEGGRSLLVDNLYLTSLIVLPFYADGKIHGYMGLCDPWPDEVWSNQDINLLRTYRDIVGEAFLRKGSEEKLRKNLESLRRTFEGTIDSVGKILEVRDPFTAGHQRRVSRLAVAIAGEMGLEKDRTTGLYYAALVHDIGKINVPSEILSKPNRLTPIEEALVKHHCNYGWEILEKVDFPWPVAEIVLQHHEYMNGSGYPRGLKGEEILLEARILSVADMVEAMSSDRPYRPALGLDSALENIIRFSGTHYDPQVADICLSLFREKGFSFEDKSRFILI